MSHINTIIIGGNLTRDPEVRYTPKGQAVCDATIANTEKWKTETGEAKERTAFVGLVIWGPKGEAFAKFHAKGQQVLVEGRITQETWDDKESGKKREKTKVQVDQWHFVGERRNAAAPTGSPTPAKTNASASSPAPRTEDDDVPF
jgi:single-strand DNA-binding protein